MNRKGVLPILAMVVGLVLIVGAAAIFLLNVGNEKIEKTTAEPFKMTLAYNTSLIGEYWDICKSRMAVPTYDGCMKNSALKTNVGVTCVFDGSSFRTLSSCQ